jgi:DNA-binding NtrC family response regulator
MKLKKIKSHILIVDDEKEICNIIQKILSSEGYQTQTANSGADAIKYLKTTLVDLMIVDIKMPNMDGLETLKQAHAIQKNLRAIFLTAYGTPPSAREALQLGAYDFIAKPFDNKLLKKVVKEVINAT